MTENKLLNEFLDINKKPLDERGYFYDMDIAYKSVDAAEDFAIGFANWITNIDKEVLMKQLKHFKEEQNGK